jgi:hypothetical protein
MTDKKNRLIERAKQSVRQPNPPRLVEAASQKRGYKVITISLYTPEAEWIEQITKALQRAGNPKANRSLVIREAILRLQKELEGKSSDEVLKDFIDHQARRA